MSALSDALNEANVEGWSAAEIARRSGDLIHRATAADVMRGKHAKKPSDDVLRAFTVVFPSLTLPQLRSLAGLPAGEDEPYQPPVEANRLDVRQRRAVDEIIRLLAETQAGGEGDDRDAAPMNDSQEPTVLGVRAAQKRERERRQKIQRTAARNDPDS